jgi:protocatechuate 3,4-dioxygenase beta subunit
MITLLPLVFSLALTQVADPQPAGQARGGTCEIRGRITDKETGLPIVRAVVRLNMVGGTNMVVARTDDDGRYQFRALPAGEYDGFVEAGEFRATHLPTSLASGGATSAPRRIVLKDGDVRTDVNLALLRALAITVRVVDEWGEPLSGLRIVVEYEGGRSAFYPSAARTTDDRGRLRLFKLPPGHYIVCAEVDGFGSGNQSTSPHRERFLRTCYPSASAAAQAEPVALERSDIDDLVIRMRRGRSFTISGTVLDASGGVASTANLSLNRFERGRSSGMGIVVGTGGRFTVTNVPPGEYAIEAELGGPDRPERRRELEVGYEPVRVDSSDVEGMVVSMSKTVEVAGRVTLEDPALPFPRPPGSGLMVSARLAGDSSQGMGSSRIAHAGEDRVFTLSGMFGRRILDVLNVPNGWYVKSIRYGGKEIIDVPTEFKAGRDAELQVILSTRGAMISGRVVNERGEAVPGARVIRLPADPAQWGVGHMTSVGVSATGTFQLGPQRGGDYLILAVIPSPRVPEPDDRDRVAHLAEVAERIRLGDEEQRTLELRVMDYR